MEYPTHKNNDPRRKSVARWISQQRTLYSKGSLSQDRTDKLEQMSGWSWNLYTDQWYATYRNVLAFFIKNGRCPSNRRNRRKNPEEAYLADWCMNHRQAYKRHKGKLSREKINILEAIPGWFWNPFDEKWEIQYQALTAFVKRNERTPVSHSNAPDEALLGRWTHRQRVMKRKNLLSNNRVEKLELIPEWFWTQESKAG